MCPRKNSQGCSHKVSISFTPDQAYAPRDIFYPAPLVVVTTLPVDLSQRYPNKEWINFKQLPLFLLTQSQREAMVRTNNMVRRPPNETGNLKWDVAVCQKNTSTPTEWDQHSQSEKYWSDSNILRCPPSGTSTVTMRNTGPTEIHFDAYLVTGNSQSEKLRPGTLPHSYTLTGYRKEELVHQCSLIRNYRMGTAG